MKFPVPVASFDSQLYSSCCVWHLTSRLSSLSCSRFLCSRSRLLASSPERS